MNNAFIHSFSLIFSITDTQSADWMGAYNLAGYQNDPTCSGKMIMFFEILNKCAKTKEKLVVFSESLSSLRAIEHFLAILHNMGKHPNRRNSWIHGKDYFSIYGGTDIQLRDDYCNQFNDEKNQVGR